MFMVKVQTPSKFVYAPGPIKYQGAISYLGRCALFYSPLSVNKLYMLLVLQHEVSLYLEFRT